MKCFDTFLNGLETRGYVNDVSLNGNIYTIQSGAKKLQIQRDAKDGECLIWSKANPRKLRKVIGSGVERVLPRLVTEFFSGNKSVSVRDPKGVRRVFFQRGPVSRVVQRPRK
jgi:hypothetical protein